MHLLIDGYEGDPRKMWDVDLVRQFLEDFPVSLGMTKLCEPQVLTYQGPKVEDSGVSGFVVIAESHISIHTFPNRNYVNIDVFSCKTFDHERALRDAKALFSLGEVKTWVLNRGLEHLDRREALPLQPIGRSSLQSGRTEPDARTPSPQMADRVPGIPDLHGASTVAQSDHTGAG